MNRQNLLRILGVIVLGALGSGLWDLVKPMLGWAYSGMISISTLGLDTLRDDLYSDAAATLGRPSGLKAVSSIVISFVFLVGVSLTQVVRLSAHLPQPPGRRRLVLGYTLLLFFGTNVMLIQALRATYVDQLARFYEKVEIIAAPNLSQVDVQKYRAAFVQVRNRAEYIQVIQSISARIQAAGGNPPTKDFY